MAISDAQFTAWLNDPQATRVILVQAEYNDGSLKTAYLSTRGMYVSGTEYIPVIKGNFSVNSSIGVDYTSSISYSDIEIYNTNGERDIWLTYVWANKNIRVYVGDATWTDINNDFRLVFSGVIGDIDSRDQSILNFKIRDNMLRLNNAISENKLGNYNPLSLSPYTNPNSESIKPLVFGEVFNITPLLTSAEVLEYMVCDGAVESILEVRDNGMPVPFTTVGVPAGSFRLVRTPVGTVTVSVQGLQQSIDLSTGAVVSTYNNNAINIVAYILLAYGKGISASNLDLVTLNSLAATAPGNAVLGIYTIDRFNVFSLCSSILESLGLCMYVTNTGLISVKQVTVPTSGGTVTVTDSDIILNSLRLSSNIEVVAASKVKFCKNWTVQEGLLTAIPQSHKDSYEKEWEEYSVVDTGVQAAYDLSAEPVATESYLVRKTDITTIESTKLDLRKTPRRIYGFKGVRSLVETTIGSTLLLNLSRFNLSGGVRGMVVSTNPNWLDNTIDIEVLV